MGISTAGHLPSITSTSYPALTSHLLSAYNAQKVGNWTVSVRVLRSVLSVENQDGTDGSQSIGNQTRARLMYVVQMSEFPNDTFVLIEDSQRETRASIRAKHAMSVMQAAAVAAVNQENNTISQQTDVKSSTQNEISSIDQESDKPIDSIQAETQGGESGEQDVKMENIRQDEESEEKQQEENKEDEVVATNAPPRVTDTDDLFSDPSNSSEMQHAEQLKTTQVAPEPENSSPVLPTFDFSYVSDRPTRHTLFAASAQYLLLLTRLNLPAPLGAPSIGDGVVTAAHAGPGAWIARGAPVSIQGATYDIPSATGYGSGGAEWRVRLGLVQSSGTRSAGALVESEYLPLLRLASDTFLSNYLHNLFPTYLTTPSQGSTQQGVNGLLQSGVAHSAPTPEQWQEVIPASNQAWMESVGITSTTSKGLKEVQRLPLQQKDRIGWQGKERGRRLAYLYITLLRNQSVI